MSTMSTIEILSTGIRAARAAARQRRDANAGTRTHASRLATAVAEHGLTLLAGGCFTAAAAMVAVPLALAVAGVALLILEARVGE